MKKIICFIVGIMLGLIGLICYKINSRPTVIITEFSSTGEIVNTLITDDYCIKDSFIEVKPLDTKDVYFLRGSVQISEIPKENTIKSK